MKSFVESQLGYCPLTIGYCPFVEEVLMLESVMFMREQFEILLLMRLKTL